MLRPRTPSWRERERDHGQRTNNTFGGCTCNLAPKAKNVRKMPYGRLPGHLACEGIIMPWLHVTWWPFGECLPWVALRRPPKGIQLPVPCGMGRPCQKLSTREGNLPKMLQKTMNHHSKFASIPRSSRRQVRIRVPFSVVYFRMGNPPPKKGKRAVLGDLNTHR